MLESLLYYRCILVSKKFRKGRSVWLDEEQKSVSEEGDLLQLVAGEFVCGNEEGLQQLKTAGGKYNTITFQ